MAEAACELLSGASYARGGGTHGGGEVTTVPVATGRNAGERATRRAAPDEGGNHMMREAIT